MLHALQGECLAAATAGLDTIDELHASIPVPHAINFLNPSLSPSADDGPDRDCQPGGCSTPLPPQDPDYEPPAPPPVPAALLPKPAELPTDPLQPDLRDNPPAEVEAGMSTTPAQHVLVHAACAVAVAAALVLLQ